MTLLKRYKNIVKVNLQDLKNLLNKIQKHQIKYLFIDGSKFKLIINAPQSHVTIAKNPQKLETQKYKPNIKYNTINIVPKNNDIEKKTNITEACSTIVSPMVGTFYRSPGPGEPPFIQVLDHVTFNQTVCIIEAMKLMNEIEAEVSGEIIEILVEDGEIVDCGQALMKVKSSQNFKIDIN